MAVISRSQILDKLDEWLRGRLSAVEMHKWALGLHFSDDARFDDWEDGEQHSVAKEVVAELYMLDMNLITPDDVPLFVDLLKTPKGRFAEAYIKFIGGLQQIDVAARKITLQDVEPYKRHCRIL